MKSDANPMHKAHSAPRCTAKSKRSGLTCGSPAVKGWLVCRMHGAGGGAPKGPALLRVAYGYDLKLHAYCLLSCSTRLD
jgi:hypothetical protein